MLGDKNWDEREGDSYKAIHSALPDLVTAWATKNPPVTNSGGVMVLFFRNTC